MPDVNPPPAVELHTLEDDCDITGWGKCSCGEEISPPSDRSVSDEHNAHAADALRAEVQRLHAQTLEYLASLATPSTGAAHAR